MANERVLFSRYEKELLVSLVQQYETIIENKTTNAIVNNQKANAWEAITETFNLTEGTETRTTKQLVQLYRNLKRAAAKGISYTPRTVKTPVRRSPTPTTLHQRVLDAASDVLTSAMLGSLSSALGTGAKSAEQGQTASTPGDVKLENDPAPPPVNGLSSLQDSSSGASSTSSPAPPSGSGLAPSSPAPARPFPLQKPPPAYTTGQLNAALTEESSVKKELIQMEREALLRRKRAFDDSLKCQKEEHLMKMRVLRAKAEFYERLNGKLNEDKVVFHLGKQN